MPVLCDISLGLGTKHQYRLIIEFELLLHSFDARLLNRFKSSNLYDDDTFAVFLAECLGLWKLGFW